MRRIYLQLSFYLLSILISSSTCGGGNNQIDIKHENCYPDRAVEKEVIDETMTCKMIAGEMMLQATSTRYIPCNIDSMELELGKEYKVSGKVYEIKPNERWAGTPFEITGIKN